MKNIKCVCALHREFNTKEGKSNEWHYYISSRDIDAEELLHHARMEWTVESMHWLLDVIFREDECRVENKNVQQNLNMARKIAINLIKNYQRNCNKKSPISNIMLKCLIDRDNILDIIAQPNATLP